MQNIARIEDQEFDKALLRRNKIQLYRDGDVSIAVQNALDTESATSMDIASRILRGNHSKFSLDLHSAGVTKASIDIAVEPDERMIVQRVPAGNGETENEASRYALVTWHSGQIEVLDSQRLTEINPYIVGYGSLHNVSDLRSTYNKTISPFDGTLSWGLLEGYVGAFTKRPTRDFWSRNPEEIAKSSVLDIHESQGSYLPVAIWDAEGKEFDQHRTFQRETEYNWIEIPHHAVKDHITLGDKLDTTRPLFAVKANPVIVGIGKAKDIVALPNAQIAPYYIETIVEGLTESGAAEDIKGSLLAAYGENVLRANGDPVVSDSRFLQAVEHEMNSYHRIQAAAGADALLRTKR